MAQQNVLFTDESSGVKITELTSDKVGFDIKAEHNSTFQSFFAQVGGKLSASADGIVTWEFTKSPQVSALFQQIVKQDIESKYTMQGPITAGGMTFGGALNAQASTPQQQSTLPGTPSTQLGTAGIMPGAAPLPTLTPVPTALPVPGSTMPGTYTPQASLPQPGFSQAGGLNMSVVSSMQSMPGTPQGVTSTYQRKERQPTRLAFGGPENDFWLYDYSDKSVAVFLGKTTYETIAPYLDQNGGKGSYLYPDGGTQGRRGWIFAKSNDKGMEALAVLMKTDIKSVCDFSKVRSYSRRGQRGSPGQVSPSPFSQPSGMPQVATGPFPGGMTLAAAPPPSNLPIPGVPDASVSLSPTDLVLKNIGELIITSKSLTTLSSKSEDGTLGETTWTFMGPAEDVDAAVQSKSAGDEDPDVVFEATIGMTKIVRINVKPE